MWNLKNWLLFIAIAVLCFGLAVCASDAPMEESSMEAEPAGEEATAESGDADEGEHSEDAEDGDEDSDGDENGDADESTSEGETSE